ncbi:MAG: hypothetical protein HUJ26_22110 [Planctomycetaceae bacterium]|nr:hypothetical protein [Planctomycetaceae bacterium]
MKKSIALTLVALFSLCLTTAISEAGIAFGKINGGTQFRSRNVGRPSTANLHHNFNYKMRGGKSRSSRKYYYYKRPTVSRNSSTKSSVSKQVDDKSQPVNLKQDTKNDTSLKLTPLTAPK